MARRWLPKISGFFDTLEDYGISIYCLLILAVLPFYFTNGYSRIGTDKAMFFRAVNRRVGTVLLVLTALTILFRFLVKRVQSSEKDSNSVRIKIHLDGRFTVTDIFVMLYGISLVLSYLLSEYQETAWYGSKGWYMGLFTQAAFVLIYFIVSRFWKPEKWILYLALPASAAVFLLGYLDRLGIHLIEMNARSESFISTIGNINWYCDYVVTTFFLGVILFWGEENLKLWQKGLLIVYLFLGFGTLITQGSESGVVTLAVVMLVLFGLSAPEAKKMERFLQIMVIFSVTCVVSFLLRRYLGDRVSEITGFIELTVSSEWFAALVTVVSVLALTWMMKCKKANNYHDRAMIRFFRVLAGACAGLVVIILFLVSLNTVYPGSIGKLSEYSLFTFSGSWGSNRGATWEATVRCFAEQNFLHKLVGVGPDAMSAYMYTDGSAGLQEMLQKWFGTATLTNGHNEWLTVLADLGVLGLASFAGIIISSVKSFVKEGRQEAVLCACGFCVLAYTVNNVFSFQQTVNGATMFVILGMGAAFQRRCRE